MTTENLPTTTNNAQPVVQNGAYNPFLAAAEFTGSGETGGYKSFASFKQGVYLHGKNKEEIPIGTEMVFNPEETKQGFVCWINGKIAHKVASRLMEKAPPKEEDLPDVELGPDDNWQQQSEIPMAELNGENEYLLSFSSFTANKVFGEFFSLWGEQRKFNMDEEGNYMFPVVALGKERCEGTDEKTGKKFSYFIPVLEIVDWISQSEMEVVSEENEQQAIAEVEDLEDEFEEEEDEFEEEEELEEAKPAPSKTPRTRTKVKKPDPSLVEEAVTSSAPITRRRRKKSS